MKKTHNRGQSMFELLVAVFIVGLTLVALVGLVTTTIGNTGFSRERTLASRYTQEALEWIRAERDNDWGVFIARASSGGTTYCLSSLSWISGPCGANQFISGTNFRRQATLIYSPLVDSHRVEARVVTSWQSSQGTHESRVTTYYTNWRTR